MNDERVAWPQSSQPGGKNRGQEAAPTPWCRVAILVGAPSWARCATDWIICVYPRHRS